MIKSAGLVMFKFDIYSKQIQVFLVHPGGPIWKNKNVWGIPKGLVEPGEDPFETAKREFKEETGIEPPFDSKFYYPLGSIQQNKQKIVQAWAFEGNFEGKIRSNTFQIEWPPKSGKIETYPEIDEGKFFSVSDAKKVIIPAQFGLIEKLLKIYKNVRNNPQNDIDKINSKYLYDNTKLNENQVKDFMDILGKMGGTNSQKPQETPKEDEPPVSQPVEEEIKYSPEKDEEKKPEGGDGEEKNPCDKWFVSKYGTKERMTRITAFDTLNVGGKDGYTFKMHDLSIKEVKPSMNMSKVFYFGEADLWLKNDKWTPIASIGMNSDLISFSVNGTDENNIVFGKDKLNNYYVRCKVSAKNLWVKLAYNIGESGDYYYLTTMPDNLYLKDVQAESYVDGDIVKRVENLIPLIGINKNKPLKEIIKTLAEYFSFGKKGCVDLTEKDQLIDCIKNKRGVCRHRAMGFFSVAHILKIPVHYCINNCHAFVEVGDGRGNWWGIDLGGCMPSGSSSAPSTESEEKIPQYGEPEKSEKPEKPGKPGTKSPENRKKIDPYLEEIKIRLGKELKEVHNFDDEKIKKSVDSLNKAYIPKQRK